MCQPFLFILCISADTVFSLILGPDMHRSSEVNSVFDSLQIRSNRISAVQFMNDVRCMSFCTSIVKDIIKNGHKAYTGNR